MNEIRMRACRWTARDILILLAGKNRRSVVNIGDAKTAYPPHLALCKNLLVFDQNTNSCLLLPALIN